LVFEFPKAAGALNGMCLIAPKVLLVADSFAGLIWRVDLDADGGRPQAREWLAHVSMGYYPGALKPEQPGVNGVRFAARTNALYYTATAKKLLMRVQVDPQTYEAAGKPELIVVGRMFDDFRIDEDREVLYLTTHRQNTIDRVSMNPAANSGFTQSVAGDPYMEELIGPSSGIWGEAANMAVWPISSRMVALRPHRPMESSGQPRFCACNSSHALYACLTTRALRTAESVPTIPPGKRPISLTVV
jgi:hypothetical protein